MTSSFVPSEAGDPRAHLAPAPRDLPRLKDDPAYHALDIRCRWASVHLEAAGLARECFEAHREFDHAIETKAARVARSPGFTWERHHFEGVVHRVGQRRRRLAKAFLLLFISPRGSR